MDRSLSARTAALALALAGLGCPGELPEGALTTGSDAAVAGSPAAEREERLDVRFLSTSGFLLSVGDDAILTDPFFSNPRLSRVLAPGCLEPDVPRVDAMMPRDDEGAPRARAVIVGQGHWDHLMDLPYVVPRHAPGAAVVGSRTVGHLLAPFGLETIAVNERAADHERMGEWIPVPGTRMRILPLVSEHAPQILGINLVTGTLDADPEEKPCASWEWLQGEAYAFVVDWLDEQGAVRFRVHFQDSATGAPFAFHPPELLDDGVPVDVALLPVASFAQVERYPEDLVAHLAPRHVVLHHWDDFFVDPREDPVVLRGQDLPELLRRLEAALPEGAGWAMPARGVTLAFTSDRRAGPRSAPR